MNKDPRCLHKGFFAGPSDPIPSDPKIYYADPSQKVIPCNRLFCRRCHTFLRNWPGYRLTGEIKSVGPESPADYQEIYETTDPSTCRFFTKEYAGNSFRVYACQCHAENLTGLQELDILIYGYFDFEPWGCVGHPQE
jgi:hypothetical protein